MTHNLHIHHSRGIPIYNIDVKKCCLQAFLEALSSAFHLFNSNKCSSWYSPIIHHGMAVVKNDFLIIRRVFKTIMARYLRAVDCLTQHPLHILLTAQYFNVLVNAGIVRCGKVLRLSYLRPLALRRMDTTIPL